MKSVHCYIIVLLFLLTSCYGHRQVGLLQTRTNLPQYDSVVYQPYRLQVNDEIAYRIMSMDKTITPTLNKNAVTRIYEDGTIDIPFVSPVKIVGLTEAEATDTLRSHLRNFIPDAEIKIALHNKQFTVLGDVVSGKYPIYKERLTIYQALAMTGDVMTSADKRHIRIVRNIGSQQPQILEFDLRTNTVINSEYYYVYPNDLIYVSRDKGSFYKVPSYASFIALVSSSVSLLVVVLNYSGL